MITQRASPRRRTVGIFLSLLVFALACGGDSTEPNIDQAFVGNWVSTSFIVDGVELMAPGSAFYVSFGFFSDGSYQSIVGGDDDLFLCDAVPSCVDDGDFSFTGSVITLDPGTVDAFDLQYSVSGDTLTVSGNIDGVPFSAVFERI
jgi:hypothetical protein